jgi:hypothetical protein
VLPTFRFSLPTLWFSIPCAQRPVDRFGRGPILPEDNHSASGQVIVGV